MASTQHRTLPAGFLESSAPNICKSTIDWTKEGIPEYDGLWAVVLDGVFTQDECNQLYALAHESMNGEWERAMVNIGGGRQAMYTDVRNCGRIIFDSRDVAARIWDRIQPWVPEIQELRDCARITGVGPAKRNETWRATRLNERLRFLKYQGGDYFRHHCDGHYQTPEGTERSYFTLHLYLNDAEGREGSEPLVGGATLFHSQSLKKQVDVVPKAGRVLLFQQRNLLHSGDDVVSGTKLTVRTDIMYGKEVVVDGATAILSGGPGPNVGN